MNERASPRPQSGVLTQRVLGTAGGFRLCPGNNGEATDHNCDSDLFSGRGRGRERGELAAWGTLQ